MDKVVIVMAAWNEAENIKKMVNTLFDEVFPKIDADMHLLVADNKSTDGMTEIIEEEMKERKNLHIVQQTGKGLGNAYISGFKYAVDKLEADAVMEMDADGQHPPEFVKPMVDAYLAGAEYVIGSRYVKGGSIPKEWALFRKAVSYFGNLYIRIVLLKPGIHDLTTGFRLTKVKGVLDKIDLDNLKEPTRFAYKIDLIYQSIKNSKKTVEVPLEFRPRITDKSKFNQAETLASLKLATYLGIKDKARFIKFGTVGFIGYVVNALGLELFGRTAFPEWGIWAAATEMAIISNFILNNLWTFKSEKITGVGKLLSKFLQFNGTSLGALAIQAVFGTIGVYFLGADKRQLLLPIIILLLVLPYNYFMYNAVIWKTWKLPWSKK
ncbi:MAG: Glycosyl transferase family 2 [Microgenomates group bacterium GW2011_GWC1_37_12b]|uniref:Glycosyl transferase family 2 n=1 Tax=Candidatus Woesebacteria bacterium GW2011_GWB1_38_8b TaxID=1618571 RepID=A0A0G0L421_9BACT|nr:MAG: Glycosyl transferase family 2 [Microgenomates group bacterium GW2011_GWC1_37_12b]KKQ86723.1 MAG: Glycosyl transferase family 2 [Candidatus Woesebacteria bacterium GW2011_GWB1_38_8b]